MRGVQHDSYLCAAGFTFSVAMAERGLSLFADERRLDG